MILLWFWSYVLFCIMLHHFLDASDRPSVCFLFVLCVLLSPRYVWVEIRKHTPEELATHLRRKGSGWELPVDQSIRQVKYCHEMSWFTMLVSQGWCTNFKKWTLRTPNWELTVALMVAVWHPAISWTTELRRKTVIFADGWFLHNVCSCFFTICTSMITNLYTLIQFNCTCCL